MRAYRAARRRSATDIWDQKTTTILVANTMLAQIPTRVSAIPVAARYARMVDHACNPPRW